ncbi:hypothetical protein [Portibacter marinus]|uniref:hypothetical protein n=1 Tax=Portibacter marinus TaxID=2898660 RepID=UPI001F3AE279|nr:hypothetical protein [Portibacter marinus]
MKSLLHFLLFCTIFISCIATAKAQESYMVHIDKPYYIAGEKIFYKLYYPEVKATAVIRVLLIDSNNNIVQDLYSESTNSSYLASCIPIPFNYTSGNYRLAFNSNYKNAGQEMEVNLAEIDIPIYNDLTAGVLEESEVDLSSTMIRNDIESTLRIDANLNNPTFSTREQVQVDAAIKLENGQVVSNASVSVAVIPKMIEESTDDGFEYMSMGQRFEGSILPFLSEQVYVKGIVYNRGDRPVRLNVIGAYADQYRSMQYTKSNTEGEFTMMLPGLKGSQLVQFLPYEQEIKDFKIKLTPPVISEPQASSLVFNEDIAHVLEQSKNRKKINQYFNRETIETNISSRKETTSNEKSDVTFVVSEYEKFDQLYDFFSELITPLTFKKVKGEMVASMNNPKSSLAVATALPGNPLFIIDGQLTRNAEYAGKVKMSNIESIELIYSPDKLRKRFNVLGLSGVVIVNTITPVFDFPRADSDDIFRLNGLADQCTFDVFSSSSAMENIPHFQSTIYWNPDLLTDSNGNLQFNFDHTDDKGEFTIVIISQDKEGNRGIQTLDYSVSANVIK